MKVLSIPRKALPKKRTFKATSATNVKVPELPMNSGKDKFRFKLFLATKRSPKGVPLARPAYLL